MAKRSYAALLLTLLLCGCDNAAPPAAGAEKETVVLDIWCERGDWDIVTGLCGDFAEEHREKNYAFTLDVPPADMTEALLSGKDTADVICFTSDMTEELVREGLLLPVEDDAGRLASSVSAVELDGVQYGFPYAADTYFLYYDRSKFTEHEAADLNKMMSKRLEDTRYSFAMALDEGLYQSAFFLAAGCDSPEEYCSEQGMLAGEYMAALTESGRFAAEFDSGDIKEGFVEGTVAAAISGLRDSEAIKSTLGSYCGTAKLPQLTLSDGRSVQLGSLAVYSAAGACSSTDSPEDALAFAKWIAGEDAQRLRLEQLNTAPVLEELCGDKSLFEERPEVSALLEQLSFSEPAPPRSQLERLDEAAEELCDTLLEEDITRAVLYEALEQLRDTCTGADNVVQ